MRIWSLPLVHVALLVCLTGCEVESEGPIRTVRDSAGVEIVELGVLPSILDPQFQWTTELELEISTQGDDPSAPPVIFQPQVILPLSDTRILVADEFGDNRLVILDSETGEVVARFGPRGQGPDELFGVPQVWLEEDGRIRVVDVKNLKVMTYSLTGRLLSRVSLPRDRLFQNVRVQSDTQGLVLKQTMHGEDGTWRHFISRLDPNTGEVIEIGSLPRPVTAGGAQSGRPIWTALPLGIVTSRSDRAVFWVLDDYGTVVRSIRLPLSCRTMTQPEIDRLSQRFGNRTGNLRLGPMAIFNEMYSFGDSVFAMFQADMWRAAEDPEIPEGQIIWRLVSISGHYLGAYLKPENFTPLRIGNGDMWGVALDGDGIPWIQRRRLIPPEVREGASW